MGLSEASDNSNNGLTEQDVNKIKATAQEEVEEWENQGLTLTQISARIYKSLYTKTASKPGTAYFLGRLLEEMYSKRDSQEMRLLFPNYLIDAIEYVTGASK